MKTWNLWLPFPPLLLLLPFCWSWHTPLAMFSQLLLHTSKGHWGVLWKAKSVCVNVWSEGCSEVVIRDPLQDKQGLSLSIYTVCVCEADDALRWSPASSFSCVPGACACKCAHCRFEWWVALRWSPRSSPSPCRPVSSVGKQKAKWRGGADEKGVQQLSEKGVYPAHRLTHEWKI